MNTFLGRQVVTLSLDDHVRRIFQRMFAYSRSFIFLQFVLRYVQSIRYSVKGPFRKISSAACGFIPI